MKFLTRTFYCSLVLVLALSPCVYAQAQDKAAAERIQALFTGATQAAQEKNLAKAIEQYDAVLSASDAMLKQKVMAVSRKAAILQTQKGPEAIVALYQDVLDKAEFQNAPERANLLMDLASYWNNVMNPHKGQAAFEQAAQWAAATRQDRLAALKGVGNSLLAQNQYELARKNYARMFEVPELTPSEHANAQLLIADAYEKEGDFAKAEAELIKATNTEGLAPVHRKGPLGALAKFYTGRNNWEAFMKTYEDIRAVDGSVDMMTMLNRVRLANAVGKKAEEERAWDEIIALPKISGAALLKPINEKLALLAAHGDAAKLKIFLASMEDRTLLPVQRATLTILATALAVPDGDFSKFKAPDLEALGMEDQAQAYFEAGKVMMYLRDFSAARFLAQKGESLFAKEPERLYEVPFVEKAPRGVSGWLSSPLLHRTARREANFEEYNKEAAALLINDVNTARNIVTDSAVKESPLAFYMAADAQGWHVFIEYKDEEAEKILAGLLSGGKLEMYMVPGMSNPYYQFLLEVPSGEITFMDWSSSNRHYRSANDYVISEVAPIPGGFGISLIFPWELIYDKLPQADEAWPFGLIGFTRQGAFTWGRGQVHELSRFGKVQFPAIEKNLPAIHRWITLRAWGKFQKSAKNVKIVWNDPEKGDPKFFETVVQPEMNRLSELGKEVSPEMSSAVSGKLFQETVPAWMEFDYWVADQRARYLAKQLMTPLTPASGSSKSSK